MKKNFIEDIKNVSNPAMKYIKNEKPMKAAAGDTDTKSKRINLLFTPALKERAQAEAARRGMSMNALICDILGEALK